MTDLLRVLFGRKYSPDQPRVPSGGPEGGQWVGKVPGGLDAFTQEEATEFVNERCLVWKGGEARQLGKFTTELLAKELTRHPRRALEQGVKGIDLYEDKMEFGDRCREVIGKRADGFYYGPDKTISMPSYNPSSEGRFTITLRHEIGHGVARAGFLGYYDWESRYGGDSAFDRLTDYSRESAGEAFADTYLAYIESGGLTTDPHIQEAFNVIDAVVRRTR